MTDIVQSSLSVREIPLTKGLVALVDSDLYPILAQYRWHASSGYARRWSGGGKNGFHIHMHHEVLRLRGISIPDGLEVDHRDRNKANNTTDNLRVVTHAVNQLNRNNETAGRPSKTGCRGVYWHADRRSVHNGYWKAWIGVNGKPIGLGYYRSFEDAVNARHAAERIHRQHP